MGATLPGELPPGPRLPRALQTLLWLGRPMGFPAAVERRYGAPHTLRLQGSAQSVFVSAPEDVRRVFELPVEQATAAEENLVLEPLLGSRSVLLLDGPEHLHRRRLLGRFLHGDAMRQHEAAIVDITASEIAAWPRGLPIPLLPRMRSITMATILRVVFGVEPGPRATRLREAVEELLGVGATWMVIPAFRRTLGPRSPWGRFLRLRAEIDRMLEEEIADRRSRGGEAADGTVIDGLLRDGTLHDADLCNELLTLLIAGLETTATELTWAFLLLLQHPRALALARDDVEWRLAAIRETLRVRPAFRLASRRLQCPIDVGGYRLPSGTTLAGDIVAAHQRAENYPHPESFDPARWVGKRPDAHTWIPFGGGLRRCLGASLAQFEMDVVLREVLGRVELRPASTKVEPVRLHAVVMVPSRGGLAVVEDRVTPPA